MPCDLSLAKLVWMPSVLLYSNILLAKLSLFVFGALFAEWQCQFISICSCFIRD